MPPAPPVDLKEIYSPAKSFATPGDLVNIIIKNAAVIAGLILLVLLILGGLGVIIGAGSGDPKKLEQGKKTLTSALIGFLLIVASVWIIQLIEFLTGLKLLPY